MGRNGRIAASCAGGLLLVLGMVASASGEQRGQRPTPVAPGQVVSNGTIYVRVRAADGSQLMHEPAIVLTTGGMDGPATGLPNQVSGDEWAFQSLQVGGDYEIQVQVEGFEPEQKFVHLPDFDSATFLVDFRLQPVAPGTATTTRGHFLLAPAAQKEQQQAEKDLKDNKIGSAQKHLEKALKIAPNDPGLNYLMGLAKLKSNQETGAASYFEKAISIDPSQADALMALGTIHYRQGDYPGAVKLLTKAVEAAPDSWQGQWMLASADLKTGEYEQARSHAERALKAGKENATRVHLILGEALERLGQNAKAREAFEEFLKKNEHDPAADPVRREIAKLKQMPATTVPVSEAKSSAAGSEEGASESAPGTGSGNRLGSAVAPNASPGSAPANSTATSSREEAKAAPPAPALPAPPAPPMALPPPANWAPPDVDADRPALVSTAACPLPAVLKQSARNAVALVKNLEEFSADEDYQSVEISRGEQVGSPLERKFRYMAFIHHIRPQLFTVEELRQPSLHDSDMEGAWVAIGAPALALAFHPFFQRDFDWQCEGLGEWKGQRAWVVRFSQSASQPVSLLHVFTVGPDQYAVALKGLAWVGERDGQVLHLETDMQKPVKSLELTREHFAIDYGLVRFQTHPVSLWLPADVNLYIAYRRHYYHSYSHYSGFQLFWVGTGQKIAAPKAQKSSH